MTRLKLHVTPGAREEEIVGWHGDSLRVKVRARPEKGRANHAALRLLARRLNVPPARVTLIRGVASRDKLVEVEGLSAAELSELLEPAAQ